VPAALVGVVLAIAVLAPVMHGGWFLVLDWVHGPVAHIPTAYWGFALPLGPIPILITGAQHVLTGPVVSWLVVALCFPVAAVGVTRLVPGGPIAKWSASAFYLVNPFVFERLDSGQVFVLLGYAVLPWAVKALLEGEDQETRLGRLLPGVWLAGATAASIHYLFIAGLVLLGVIVWRHRLTTLWWAMQVFVVSVVLDAYLLIPVLGGSSSGVAVGHGDLEAYKTAGDPIWGLFVNVAGLYGFWRESSTTTPKSDLSAWPVILLALLIVAGVGIAAAWRKGHRQLAGVLVLTTVTSYFLALGSQGPTGWLFTILYDHLPGFNVLREPEKFVGLMVVGYAVAFGLGAEEMVARLTTPRSRAIAAIIALIIPLAYTPTIWWGLDGQLKTSHYPASWAAANKVMGTGPGQILFLPWEEYLSFPWTHGQVIANPASQAFSRTVISGDNVQTGDLESDSTSKRSAYLMDVFADGPKLHNVGRVVGQLGISYIVLADNTFDAGSYRWLAHQNDLKEVFNQGGLQVWKNLNAIPSGTRVSTEAAVPSIQVYIRDADRADVLGVAAVIEHRPLQLFTTDVGDVPGGVRRTSPVSYAVTAGQPGWVIVPEDYDSGWTYQGHQAIALADGVVAFPTTEDGGTATYGPWSWALAGDSVSGAAVLALAGGGVVVGWRRRRAAGSGRTPEDQRVDLNPD
jgi:hypothetical protein